MLFRSHHNKWRVATPVFLAAHEDDILKHLDGVRKEKYPELTHDCKITLYDGRTGRVMDGKVTVGIMYMLKLIGESLQESERKESLRRLL